MGTFRWGHFLPPFLDLLFTCIDTIEDHIHTQMLVYDTYFKPFFSFVVPLPHRWHYTLRRKTLYFLLSNQAKKRERGKTSRLKSHPLQSPQWVTLQSRAFLSLWKTSSSHINQKQRLFLLFLEKISFSCSSKNTDWLQYAAEKLGDLFSRPSQFPFSMLEGRCPRGTIDAGNHIIMKKNYEED